MQGWSAYKLFRSPWPSHVLKIFYTDSGKNAGHAEEEFKNLSKNQAEASAK